jgi:starch synthase
MEVPEEMFHITNLIMSIMKINHSDAVIVASEGVSSSLTKFIESSGKPFYLRPKTFKRRIVFYNEML